MVENIGNPDEVIGGELATKIEINLGEFAKSAKFYSRGKLVERTPINGVFTKKCIAERLFLLKFNCCKGILRLITGVFLGENPKNLTQKNIIITQINLAFFLKN